MEGEMEKDEGEVTRNDKIFSDKRSCRTKDFVVLKILSYKRGRMKIGRVINCVNSVVGGKIGL